MKRILYCGWCGTKWKIAKGVDVFSWHKMQDDGDKVTCPRSHHEFRVEDDILWGRNTAGAEYEVERP